MPERPVSSVRAESDGIMSTSGNGMLEPASQSAGTKSTVSNYTDTADASIATDTANTAGTVKKPASQPPTSSTPTKPTKTRKHSTKVGLPGLMAIVISAMIGGGVFNLPQNMAQHASAGPQIIAWAITAVGIWLIANTFRVLSEAKSDLKDGLYNYAYHGFGKFIGFLIAYGYWICNCFSLIAYGVLIMSTLDYFFPGTFTGGNNLASIIGSSVILWGMFLLALLGVKSGAVINIIGTICKIVPVLVFIVAMLTLFKFSVFVNSFWGLGANGQPLHFEFAPVMHDVSSTMLVTLWLFIGIEGAVVISGEARSQKDVSKATSFGYLFVLLLYLLVSLLPLGVESYQKVGKLKDPSMAMMMNQYFGAWGADLVNAGVIISVIFAWLVWMIMLSQMPLYAARDGLFPQSFQRKNKHGAPWISLLAATIICQVLFICTHFIPGDAWDMMISLTSVMVMPCYLLSCMYLWKVAARKQNWPKGIRFSRTNGLITGILGTIFSLYLVYSAGLKYLMIACVVFALGLPMFWIGRRQKERRGSFWELFTWLDYVMMALVIVVGVVGVIYTVNAHCFTL